MFSIQSSDPKSSSLSSTLSKDETSTHHAATERPKTVTSTPRPNDSSFWITSSPISSTRSLRLGITALDGSEDKLYSPKEMPQQDTSPTSKYLH